MDFVMVHHSLIRPKEMPCVTTRVTLWELFNVAKIEPWTNTVRFLLTFLCTCILQVVLYNITVRILILTMPYKSPDTTLMVRYPVSIGHFWVTLCLYFNTMQNLSYENKFDLRYKNEPVDGTHFQINGFLRRLVWCRRKIPSGMAYSRSCPCWIG